mgnify:CR=1 FL=1
MVTIRELLNKFNIKLSLTEIVLNMSYEPNYTSFEKKTYTKNGEKFEYYIFHADLSKLIIRPYDPISTVEFYIYSYEGAFVYGECYNEDGMLYWMT